MTTRELLYVKTAAEEKSISRAAKKLFVAQPSLSQALQRIEDSIGARLFVRGVDGLRLTYAGERYYHMACQVLKIYDEFTGEVTDINDLKTGHITFGITNHLGAILLPRFLPEFTEKYPGITYEIFEGSTTPQEEKLLSGQLDFSIMHAPVEATDQNPMLKYEILKTHPFVVCLSENSPLVHRAIPVDGYPYPVLDIQLLKDVPLLTLHKEQRIRHVTDAVLKRAGIEPKIQLLSRNYMTVEKLAAEGLGYTLQPMDYVTANRFDHPPIFLCLEDKWKAEWSLCVTTLKDGFLSKADKTLLQLLRAAEGVG